MSPSLLHQHPRARGGSGQGSRGLSLGPHLLKPDPASLPHHQQTRPESGQHRSPHLLSGHCPLPSFWPSGCQQAHLKIHVSILAPHWKPALAAACEAPPPSASFLSLVQPQAASLAGKGKPECGHRALALVEGCSASRTVPPAPGSPLCPPWLKHPFALTVCVWEARLSRPGRGPVGGQVRLATMRPGAPVAQSACLRTQAASSPRRLPLIIPDAGFSLTPRPGLRAQAPDPLSAHP